MKTAFSTVCCMELDAAGLKKLCEKYEIDSVELRADKSGNVINPQGLNVSNVGSGFCLQRYDEQMLFSAKQLIDYAKTIGAKGIRVFLGNFFRRYDDIKNELDYHGIVKSLQELCDYSEVEIWVETHNEFSTGVVLSKLIQDVGRGNFKIIWDIIHPIEDGEAIEKTWELIGNSIAHVHIKDGKKRADSIWHDYEYTPLGEGELPVREVIELLKQNEFEGHISLEWENIWRDELKRYPTDMDWILSMFKEAIV